MDMRGIYLKHFDGPLKTGQDRDLVWACGVISELLRVIEEEL